MEIVILFETDEKLVLPYETLVGADLSGGQFHRAIFSDMNLSKITLSRANLRNAIFDNANLSDAILDNAMLANGYLAKANLTNASLNGSHVFGADFSGAILLGVDMRCTGLDNAKLENATYDNNTQWPEDFDPASHGAIKID